MPNTTNGYTPQHTTASTSVDTIAPRISENNSFINLNEVKRRNDEIDQLDADERNDDTAQTVDQQIALQRGQCADRRVLHAAQRQRNQRDDDERVEDH